MPKELSVRKANRTRSRSPLRNAHPASLLRQQQRNQLPISNPAFLSTPNIIRKKEERTELVPIRRVNSTDYKDFQHSWDYSPIPCEITTKKKSKRRKREKRSKSKRRKKRSTSIRFNQLPITRNASFEQELGLKNRSRRNSELVRSEEFKLSDSLTHSSEPEELDICDDDDDDEESVPTDCQHTSTFSSSVAIDESPRPTKPKRSHSFSDLSRALRGSRAMSFDDHRDQFERLWQASQIGKISFKESQSIVYDTKLTSRISSGTLPHLINKLADQEEQDSTYISTFLCTHMYYISVENLMNCFFERYLMEPSKVSQTDITKWEGPIRIRLINVLKIWVSKHFCLFDKKSLEKLCSYIEGLIIPRQQEWGKRLQEVIADKIAEHEKNTVTLNGEKVNMEFLADYILRFSEKFLPKSKTIKRYYISEQDILVVMSNIEGSNSREASENLKKLTQAGFFSKNNKKGYLLTRDQSSRPKSLISASLKQFHDPPIPFSAVAVLPKELARQLTLIEFDLFCHIQPSRDLVNVSKTKSEPVNDCIQYSNRLSRWVAGEVVQSPNAKNRAAVLRTFIETAEECWKLNNFSSAAAIIYGLDHRAVQRLKLTWKMLPKRTMKTFEDFLELVSVKDNFEKLRVARAKASPPLVPYLALYLKDISLLELGNPTIVEGTTDILNFSKFSMIADRFFEIQMLQRCGYNFRWCSVLSHYLQNIQEVTEDVLYKFSDLCEERIKTEDIVPLRGRTSSAFKSLHSFRRTVTGQHI